MTTGEKIRKLRTDKMMTQSQLVGTHITRNMLSRIESDEANPSLGTLLFLASRLGVPAGYLLADENQDKVYAKSFVVEDIKRSFKSGSYAICRQLCIESEFVDDEIMMLAAEACFAVAVEEFDKGHLKVSVSYFDEAITFASETSYYSEHIKAACCMYFRYMQKFSPNLASGIIDENSVEYYCAMSNDFCRYIYALDGIANSHFSFASEYVKNGDREDPAVLHLGAKIDMHNGNFRLANIKLQQVLTNDRQISRPLLYEVLLSLEECAKSTDDFRAAYEYSTTKMDILQKMLADE